MTKLNQKCELSPIFSLFVLKRGWDKQVMERWSKYQADFLLDQGNDEARTEMSSSVLLSM